MTQPDIRELPETVKFNLLALAISKAYLRHVRAGVKRYRNKIEAEKPGASRLTANHAVMAEIICEINVRDAQSSTRRRPRDRRRSRREYRSPGRSASPAQRAGA